MSKVRLFFRTASSAEEPLNLFAACCRSHGITRGKTRSFSLGQSLLLYAILLHLIEDTPEFRPRLRMLRNLIEASTDELRPDQIDEAIRERIGEITARRLSAVADKIGDGFAAGLAGTDVAQAARAAAVGAVGTLYYDMTADVRGTLDADTGAITFDENGEDLLAAIALLVLANGGEVHAVRPGEIDAEIWNGRLLAGLRRALA